jgi:hypothetical protein
MRLDQIHISRPQSQCRNASMTQGHYTITAGVAHIYARIASQLIDGTPGLRARLFRRIHRM